MTRTSIAVTLAACVLTSCAPEDAGELTRRLFDAGDAAMSEFTEGFDDRPDADAAPETPDPVESGSGSAGSPGVRTSHMPTDAEREAILAAVQGVFDALASGDGEILREIMHPDVLMHSVERAADGTRSSSTSTRDQLIARLEGSAEVLTERMWDAEARVSGDLAMVWTPYDFYVGDALSHCGADALLLTRNDDESWKIVALSWTRLQPPECELHPEGPPV